MGPPYIEPCGMVPGVPSVDQYPPLSRPSHPALPRPTQPIEPRVARLLRFGAGGDP